MTEAEVSGEGSLSLVGVSGGGEGRVEDVWRRGAW